MGNAKPDAARCRRRFRASQSARHSSLPSRSCSIAWVGCVVSDDALTSCIQELRGALKDDARRPRYIETHHRRGYRLLVAMTRPRFSGRRARR